MQHSTAQKPVAPAAAQAGSDLAGTLNEESALDVLAPFVMYSDTSFYATAPEETPPGDSCSASEEMGDEADLLGSVDSDENDLQIALEASIANEQALDNLLKKEKV